MKRMLFVCVLVSLMPLTASAQTPQNTLINHAIASGERLPPGTLWFTPPLWIKGGQSLRGSLAPGGTTLRPLGNNGGTLIALNNYADSEPSGLFQPIELRDIRLRGSGPDKLEYGLMLTGARITVDNVNVTNVYMGIALNFSVDNDIRRSVFGANRFNAILLEWNAITTTRFISTQFRQAEIHAIIIRHGNDVVFENCIIESNTSYGLVIEGLGVERVLMDGFWFENNGLDIYDPNHVVKLGTGRFVQKSTQKMTWYEAGRVSLVQ